MSDILPEPHPPGTRIWSSGSGWIPAGGGKRLRATKGTIKKALEYYPKDKSAGDWAIGWMYLVRWDGVAHDSIRHERCMRPIHNDPLDALADI